MPMGAEAHALRLRRAIRDLVAVATVPAVWAGREPRAIAAGLVDVLVNALYLDFAFVRLCDPTGGAAVEIAREAHGRHFLNGCSNISPSTAGSRPLAGSPMFRRRSLFSPPSRRWKRAGSAFMAPAMAGRLLWWARRLSPGAKARGSWAGSATAPPWCATLPGPA